MWARRCVFSCNASARSGGAAKLRHQLGSCLTTTPTKTAALPSLERWDYRCPRPSPTSRKIHPSNLLKAVPAPQIQSSGVPVQQPAHACTSWAGHHAVSGTELTETRHEDMELKLCGCGVRTPHLTTSEPPSHHLLRDEVHLIDRLTGITTCAWARAASSAGAGGRLWRSTSSRLVVVDTPILLRGRPGHRQHPQQLDAILLTLEAGTTSSRTAPASACPTWWPPRRLPGSPCRSFPARAALR